MNHKLLLVALMAGLALVLMPPAAEAAEGKWIDQITDSVKRHQELAGSQGMEQAYDPYLGQLAVARRAFNAGEGEETYLAINRLMDMLEAKAEGIPGWPAKALFDVCGEVTPAKHHMALVFC